MGEAPAKFRLLVQVAEKGDMIENPSVAWPDTRRTLELGTIEIVKPVAENAAFQRQTVFLPGAITDGIEAADPMIGARDAAYAVSFSRRNQ